MISYLRRCVKYHVPWIVHRALVRVRTVVNIPNAEGNVVIHVHHAKRLDYRSILSLVENHYFLALYLSM